MDLPYRFSSIAATKGVSMKISVFGTGYVGLVQGAVLADAGHQVTCVDLDEKKLQDLREGVIPIFEPGLDSIVKNAYADGRLVFTSDAALAVQHAISSRSVRRLAKTVAQTCAMCWRLPRLSPAI